MSDFPDIESRLRESLAEHARRAPEGSALAEQVISTVTPAPVRFPRRWRTWSLPLVTAGAVAAVAGAVVGVVHATHSAAPKPLPPANSQSAVVTAVPSTMPSATPGPSAVPSVSSPPRSSAVPVGSGAAVDLTFVGTDGWAVTGDGVLLRSTDDGNSWQRAGTVPPDVAHLRFATTTTGYAFGQDVLYLTTDGGARWMRQSGGALALETLDNNVIRVSTACLPGCPATVQTAPIGSGSWTTTATLNTDPGATLTAVALARTGRYAYLALAGNAAGGASSAHMALWVSGDDGRTWSDQHEPCLQNGGSNGEVDGSLLTTAPDGSVAVMCTPRLEGTGWQFPMSSPAGGAAFVAGNRQAFGNGSVRAFALASRQTVVVSLADGTYRSTDGGQTFARLGADSGSDPGPLQWLGFASPAVGHGLSQDGRTVWTTTDAGATWTAARLP